LPIPLGEYNTVQSSGMATAWRMMGIAPLSLSDSLVLR